jgi:hypothetical protein
MSKRQRVEWLRRVFRLNPRPKRNLALLPFSFPAPQEQAIFMASASTNSLLARLGAAQQRPMLLGYPLPEKPQFQTSA